MSVTSRVVAAITNELRQRESVVEGLRNGTLSVIVKIDAAGCPRTVQVRTETTNKVETPP